MPELVIFLDDGGVLNDNAVRGAQWQALAGEYFAPRFGGTPAAWARANRAVMEGILEPTAWNALMTAAPNYAAFERQYYATWMNGMCDLVGVLRLPDDECLPAGLEAEAYILPRLRSAYPGAADAIRTLHAAGYALHTASGANSRTMGIYLDTLGVRECFGRLYGPDLIETFKNGPAFYEGILADLALRPGEALFVDDNPMVLGWAAQAGARGLLVGRREGAGDWPQIGRLAELPRWLALET